MSLSLRSRIAVAFAVAFLLTLAVLFTTLHYALRGVLIADLDDELDHYGEALVLETTQDGAPASANGLAFAVGNGALDRLAGQPLLAGVFDRNGRLLRASRALPEEARTLRASDVDRLRRGESWQRTLKPSGAQSLRVSFKPVFADGSLVAVLETAAPLNQVTSATDRLQGLLWAEGAVAVVIATAAGYGVARRGLRPLNDVATLAADIEAHGLDRRLRLARAPLEIRRLAETFDAMLDRLEHAFTLQRAFASDVAHELRTPLTALRGNLDVLLLDPTLDPEVHDEIERLAAETGRMMRLTSNLLALAQAEAGRTPDRRPVDVDVLCLEVYRQARNLGAGVRLRLGHEDQVTVLGDQDLLKQLVLNLVENAMKYTPPGGMVMLSLFRDEATARIVVEDSGPGIRAEDLPHIFDRFYRAPAGAGRITGGAGIGLAVARWIATEHAGWIEVRSAPGKGSTFTVRLPLAHESGQAPEPLAAAS